MRKHRRSVRLRRRVLPPDVYFLSSAQTAAALGVSKASLARWRAVWKRYGHGPGIEPVYLASRLPKYRIDDIRCYPGTFLERMKNPGSAPRKSAAA